MVNYQWKATFVLTNARCDQPFTRNGWNIEGVQPIDNLNKVKFTKEFEETTNKEYWTVYNEIWEEFEKLLNAAMSGLLFYADLSNFSSVSEKELKLTNSYEIVTANQQLPIRFSMTFTNTLDLSESHFDATLVNLATIEASPNKDLINHCLHLFRQGLTYSDSSDKFFTLWRTFNALYNHFSPSPRESTSIKGTIDQLSTAQVDLIINAFTNVATDELRLILAGHQSNLFNYLASAALIDDNGHNRSQELQDALTSSNHKETVKCATFCFYVLRCKYAHGSDQAIIQNEKMFKAGSYFLASLLSILLNKLAH
jgi:hypothetical protein